MHPPLSSRTYKRHFRVSWVLPLALLALLLVGSWFSMPDIGKAEAEATIPGTGQIVGKVFNDINGNTEQDAGEPGLADVNVKIFNAANQEIADLTTAADGGYARDNLAPGAYTVVETDPAGFGSTTPNERAAAVVSGAVTTINFGDRQLGTIVGTVFEDINRNGVKDLNEVPLANVTIRLFRNNQQVGQTTTNADGLYSFTGLNDGAYTVLETDPPGYTSVTPNSRFGQIVGGSGLIINFGDLPLGTVSGFVYRDTNINFVRDNFDLGLANVAVRLERQNGQVVQQTTTDANGFYRFFNVLPGVYRIRELNPAGFFSTTPDLVQIALNAAGAAVVNFGDIQPGTLAGTVWEDRNLNFLRDPNEVGLANVTVRIRRWNGAVYQLVNTALTDANGGFAVSGLTPGYYLVEEIDPAGYTSLSRNQVYLYLPAFGVRRVAFADIPLGAVIGKVFEDRDGNRLVTPNESGIGGVTVRAVDAFTGQQRVTTTGGDGSFVFTGLPPFRVYYIIETDPAGYASSTSNFVGTYVTPFTAGAALFGDVRLNTISGMIFEDLNANRRLDPTEVGVGEVVVELQTIAGEFVLSTTTDATGAYEFANVAPGNYNVTVNGDVGEAYALVSPDPVAVTMINNGIAIANFYVQEVGTLVGSGVPGTIVIGSPVANAVTASGPAIAAQVAFTVEIGADGNYVVRDLDAGDYTLTQTPPEGFVGDLTPIEVNLPTNGAAQAAFDAAPTNTIGGVVFEDINGNGSRDEGELGIPGVALDLKQGATTVATTTTTLEGSYQFGELDFGAYTVVETDPDGYHSVTPNSVDVTLSAQTPVGAADFGDRVNGEVAGVVFRDDNFNGAQDDGEIGLGNVQVRLLPANGTTPVAETVTTPQLGEYRFTGVANGAYRVEVVGLPDFNITTAATVDLTLDNATRSAAVNFGQTLQSFMLFWPWWSRAVESSAQ